MATDDPVGISDIARRAQVREITVRKWRMRHDDFPPPRWTVSDRPAWNWPEVEAWLNKTGRLSAE